MMNRLTRVRGASRKHLTDAGEGYFKHLLFTVTMSWQIVVTALCLLVHGLVPGWHTRTTSRRIEALHRVLQQRLLKTLREQEPDA